MKCTACGKEHSLKDVLYTENGAPYCANAFTCNDEHPNSVKNILTRQGSVTMYTESELEDNVYERLNIGAEMKERIGRIVSKPQSIRLSKVEVAYYLIQLQENMGLNSLAEAIRYCITETAKRQPMRAIDLLATPVKEEVAVTVEHEVVDETPTQPQVEDDFTF